MYFSLLFSKTKVNSCPGELSSKDLPTSFEDPGAFSFCYASFTAQRRVHLLPRMLFCDPSRPRPRRLWSKHSPAKKEVNFIFRETSTSTRLCLCYNQQKPSIDPALQHLPGYPLWNLSLTVFQFLQKRKRSMWNRCLICPSFSSQSLQMSAWLGGKIDHRDWGNILEDFAKEDRCPYF